ncbi:MAG: hypothetical protein EHM18_10155, partial [Acidobacteria bacterium]
MRDVLLTPEQISDLAPHTLIEHVIRGIKKDKQLTVGVMLDRDEPDPRQSKGTGKFFIRDPFGQDRYCALLQNSKSALLNQRCARCDRSHFDVAKQKATDDPNYTGEIYSCSAGGLLDFVVPIVEKEGHTFIGAVFGGQKRPRENIFAAIHRLRRFVKRPGNEALGSLSFWYLLWLYLRLEQSSTEELRHSMQVCVNIAAELAKPFEEFAKVRKNELEVSARQQALDQVSSALIAARDIDDLFARLQGVLSDLQAWLNFDWAVLVRQQGRIPDGGFSVIAELGRGLREVVPPDKCLTLDVATMREVRRFVPGLTNRLVPVERNDIES